MLLPYSRGSDRQLTLRRLGFGRLKGLPDEPFHDKPDLLAFKRYLADAAQKYSFWYSGILCGLEPYALTYLLGFQGWRPDGIQLPN